jgi:glycosyltransferase involved in cell wall biosynthesis
MTVPSASQASIAPYTRQHGNGSLFDVMGRAIRVMIDARMLIGRFSGVSRVVTRLVEELAKQDGIEVVTLCGEGGDAGWAGRSGIEMVSSSFTRRDRVPLRRVFWEETRLPGIIASAKVDLFHATWNFGIPAFCPVPSVLTVHDLIPWFQDAPRGSRLHRLCYRYAVRAAVRRASRVTTVSHTVRRQVMDTLHADPERLVAVPNGVDLPTGKRTDDSSPKAHYALYVGGHEPRKNVAGVLRAMQRYWRRFDTTLELRMTGTADSLSPDAAAAYSSLPCDAPVRFLGNVTDAVLAQEYSLARVLLLLSYNEGFGLPVLEALGHGCPVVAADRAALPEVVADAGLLVDPDDADAVAEAMYSLISDSGLRAGVVDRGKERARGFGWDVTADRMRAVYESALLDNPRLSCDTVVSYESRNSGSTGRQREHRFGGRGVDAPGRG